MRETGNRGQHIACRNSKRGAELLLLLLLRVLKMLGVWPRLLLKERMMLRHMMHGMLMV